MLERLTDYFIAKPRRLVTLGAGLVRAGGFLVVAGLVGRVATTGASAVKGLGGGMQAEVALSDVLPGYLSVWMPESALGFAVAMLLLIAGLIAVRTGRVYERYLGN
ncbi:hypothetical protein ACFO3A_13835 [Comamonas nitrativorans]|uniref:Uncharacterized protein n=1 Tax=Comamonas nitrativorans TaxID=108437 RepID=A0ABV9H1L2_9BURK